MRVGRTGASGRVIAAGVVVTGVCFVTSSEILHSVVLDSLSVTLAVLAFVAVGRRRLGWPGWFLAGGVGLWVIGDFLWEFDKYSSGRTPTGNGPADVLYLLGYTAFAAGLFTMARRNVSGGRRIGMVDALAFSVAVGQGSWQFLIRPALESATTPLDVGYATIYPIFDLCLLAALLWIALSPGVRRPATRLFVLGLSSFMVLDVTYVLIQNSSSWWVDTVSNLYPMVYALMISALWHPSSPELFSQAGEGSDRLTGGRLFLLGSSLFIIPVLTLVDNANGKQQSVVSTALSFIVTAFVLLRLARLVADREQARIQLETVNNELQATHGAVKYQATHDPLSGLANRSALFEHFSLLADDRRIAVLFADLDGFKSINDTHGHQAGDQLLVEVARRLESVVNVDELVCRVGGDEFVIVCPVEVASLGRPLELAGAISEVLAEPIDLAVGAHGVRVGVGISIGISRVSPSSSFERLLGEADEAMYAAKRSKCGHVVYGEDVDSMSAMTTAHGHHRTTKRTDQL